MCSRRPRNVQDHLVGMPSVRRRVVNATVASARLLGEGQPFPSGHANAVASLP